MPSYPGNYRICATCAYWVARRDADLYGARVTECDEKGRCAVHQGPYRNMQRPCNGSACEKHLRWPVLR